MEDGDGEDVEPIVKVCGIGPCGLLPQGFDGRCHDPGIDFDGMGRAQALKLVMLDYPEQLGLYLQRQFPDLVQAKGGTIGDLEPATCRVSRR